jgi:hypothetical protein
MDRVFPLFVIGIYGRIQKKVIDGPFKDYHQRKRGDEQHNEPDISFLQQEYRDQGIYQEIRIHYVKRQGPQEDLENLKVIPVPDSVYEGEENNDKYPEKEV